MKILSIICLCLLSNIIAFMFEVDKYDKEYCFMKNVFFDNETMAFSFITVGEEKEYVDVVLQQITPEKKDIFSKTKVEKGRHVTKVLEPGKYKLCFYPYTSNSYSISFSFLRSEEDVAYLNVATDKQMKEVHSKIGLIKESISNYEIESRNLMNKKFTHFTYLNNYLKQIKILTFVKILIVGMLSMFQIYVIQKMFGEDKRMTKIKTSAKNTKQTDFL